MRKNKFSNSKNFLLLIAIISITSCKPKFDKSVAEEVISKDLSLPYLKQLAFVSTNLDLGFARYNSAAYKGEYALNNAGFRNNEVSQYQSDGYIPYTKYAVNFQFTANATQYIKSKRTFPTYTKNDVEVGTILLDKVTNFRLISETEYEVEFDLKYELNPIGKIVQTEKKGFFFDNLIVVNSNDKRENDYTYTLEEKELKNLKVSIQKYEDGWKINTEQLHKILKEKFGIKQN